MKKAREEDRPARNRAGVSAAVRARLNSGELASRTLVELLVIDFAALMRAVEPRADAEAMSSARDEGITRRMELGGALLLRACGVRGLRSLAGHASDTVRGWAAYGLVRREGLALEARLHEARVFADDGHSGVREWAWLAARPGVVAEPGRAVGELVGWTGDASANVRRFASEVTRPRGVWCAHIGEFKSSPAGGLAVLEPLRADGSKYVQDSVGNWLNDASKSDAGWVRRVVAQWRRENAAASTERICRRALRTVGE